MTALTHMDARELKDEVARMERGIAALAKQLEEQRVALVEAKALLAKRTRKIGAVRVSDHAVLRYIERVYEVDVDRIRQSMLSPMVEAALKAGATKVTIGGIGFKCCDGTVVTVVDGAPWRKKAPKDLSRDDRRDFEEAAE